MHTFCVGVVVRLTHLETKLHSLSVCPGDFVVKRFEGIRSIIQENFFNIVFCNAYRKKLITESLPNFWFVQFTPTVCQKQWWCSQLIRVGVHFCLLDQQLFLSNAIKLQTLCASSCSDVILSVPTRRTRWTLILDKSYRASSKKSFIAFHSWTRRGTMGSPLLSWMLRFNGCKMNFSLMQRYSGVLLEIDSYKLVFVASLTGRKPLLLDPSTKTMALEILQARTIPLNCFNS